MKRRLSALAAVPFLAAGALAGCSDASGDSATGGGGGKEASTPATLDTLAGAWTFEGGEADGRALDRPSGDPVDFVVEEDGSFHGTGGCNNIMGTLSVDAGAIDLGAIGATMMWCGDEEMAFETAYLSALDQVTSGAVDGDELTLEGEDAKLHYARS